MRPELWLEMALMVINEVVLDIVIMIKVTLTL